MARLWYGGTSADFVIRQGAEADIYALNPTPPHSPIASDLFGTAALLPLASVPFDVYTDAELTTITTSLLDEASAAITQVTPGNVETNKASPGTFETDLESWTPGGTVVPTVTRDNTRAKHGTWSMKVVWGTGGVFPSVHKTITGLTIGTRYHCFAFAWVVAGDPGLSFIVAGITGAHHPPSTVEEEWTLLEYSFVATATSHSVQFWPSVAPTSGDTAWIDDVIIQEATDFETRGTIPRFQGPDGHEGPLWLSFDGVTGYRLEPESGPLYTRAATFDADIDTAQADIATAETNLGALDVRTDALEAVTPSPVFQRFTSSGTWTKPAGAKSVFVQCQAGGASGGGCAATSAGQASEGGGGGGGGYVAHWFDADDLDATMPVTVGAGGTAGSAGSAGNDGSNSSFGTAGVDEIHASGGLAGSAGSASSGTAHANGGHGSSGGPDGGPTPGIIVRGGDGGAGVVIGAASVRENHGGWSTRSGEVRNINASTGGQGATTNRGGGGSGARNAASQSARAGGAGGSGFVEVTTYF